ncbi:MAG TPA: MltA domain-containing protein [Burkholderiales bacterium]|nr:MltA domain-containing protein [Burkholderiales bacterium]
MQHFNESPLQHQMRSLRALLFGSLLVLAGCESIKPQPEPPKPVPPKETPAKPPVAGMAGALRQASWQDLPDWREESPELAWESMLTSCRALAKQDAWREVCAAAESIKEPDREAARRFFELHLTPFQLTNADGSEEGLVTGYYEPLLKGSRKRSARYRFPVFGVPDDMLVLDLTEVYPELKGMRLRGRLDGRRIVPYYDRAQIEQGRAALAGKEIVWVEDVIELFFLQIQGSGRVTLDTGETIRVGYADQNGHPYRSIGRLLVERGELPLERASMQGIQAWARRNPEKLSELLNYNASYVFFRELPSSLPGPLGALGLPLTARRSVAVDARFVPLGAPVYLATTWPLSSRPLNRLMLAQDTGGAIRGAVRADFFWGFGEEAAREAGRMKQSLRMWVLLPNAYRVPGAQP